MIRQSIFGIDRDPAAIQAARERLAARWPLLATSAGNLRAADALTDDVIGGERFDAIVGNPPYVNVRILARTGDADRKRVLAERYKCARGAYDLYVLFLERAFELLRPGGVCGMIVPNKIATLGYALPCRKLLLERTSIQQVTDITELQAFGDTGVYPYIVVWQKTKPAATHSIPVLVADSLADLSANKTTRQVRQSSLSPEGFAFHGALEVERRVSTLPFEKLADLHSGTAGFSAGQVATELCEADELPEADEAGGKSEGRRFDFIVSGNIDPYAIRLGDVRFMKRRFHRPVLAADSDCLTDAKRDLFRGPKIVIAGLTKRLEAAYDAQGLALGVQVYTASQFREDAFYLLGLLNSKLMSHLFRLRFQAKRLAGGYLSINKSQLALLPIRTVAARDRIGGARRAEIIRAVGDVVNAAGPLSAERLAATMREIDRLVYSLYELKQSEIDKIESTLPDLVARSAA